MDPYREFSERGTPDFRFACYKHRHPLAGTMINMHWHPEIEMLYMRRGEIEVTAGNEKRRLKNGDIIFIEPDRLHMIVQKTPEIQYDAAVFSTSLIEFSDENFFQTEITAPLKSGEAEFSGAIPSGSELNSEISYIARKMFDCDINSKAAVIADMVYIMSRLYDAKYIKKSSAKPDKHSACIKTCIEYMQKNYRRKISLEELADTAHMSPNYFCRYYKQYAGITPFEQLNGIRVKNAAALLGDTDMTVADISRRCGFENVGYFIRKFRAVVGCTPGEYRKTKAANDNAIEN